MHKEGVRDLVIKGLLLFYIPNSHWCIDPRQGILQNIPVRGKTTSHSWSIYLNWTIYVKTKILLKIFGYFLQSVKCKLLRWGFCHWRQKFYCYNCCHLGNFSKDIFPVTLTGSILVWGKWWWWFCFLSVIIPIILLINTKSVNTEWLAERT